MKNGSLQRISASRCNLALSLVLVATVAVQTAPANAADSLGPNKMLVGGSQLRHGGVIANLVSTVPQLPETTAGSYLIADLKTGQVLAAKNPHLRLPPASTLKTLMAVALLPRLKPTATYTAQTLDQNVIGTIAGIYPGRTYSIKSLWNAALLLSGNDAALALAHAAGGFNKTVSLMNKTAHQLRAYDTFARTPHGLDSPGQVSSAYDLALIGRAAMKRRDFRRYVDSKEYIFPNSGSSNKPLPIANQNKMLETYPGTIGIKTGYTTQAMNTYIGAATRNGHTLIITLMHLSYGRDALATKLFDWGFAADGRVKPVGVLVNPVR
ncbi:MAG TPA: serine hydrolase [Candidatus Nanopelagicaceae bacterium]|nr:serine hydrolase [Candidatus Nanopelagicaceae bacterium]